MSGAAIVSILFFSNANGSSECPLAPCEVYFVNMIIKLSQFRHSIRASERLELIKSLFKTREIENKVKDWKLKHSRVNNINYCNSAVGSGYWNRF